MQYLLAGWCGISGQALGEGLSEPLDTVYGAMTLGGEERVSGGKKMQSDGKLEGRGSIVASAGMPPMP